MARSEENGWAAWEQRFPVLLKFGGLLGALAATAAAFSGVEFGVPLLSLFGLMMGIGGVTDALRERK